jgi:trigger factor
MKVEKKDLGKSQWELTIELSLEEFQPFIEKGAEQVSREVKIDGFRPGKVPYDVLKAKIGEMTILEESARLAINKTIDDAIKENINFELVGQPQVNITKLAPDNPLEYKIVIAVLPEVRIGSYKDLGIKAEKDEVKGEEVEKMVKELQEFKVKEALVDREAREGDKLIATINMYLDNVPIEGGLAKDTPVVLGKEYFVAGFDKKLVGMRKGEAREFKLSYPDDFHGQHLAGKMVEFKVEVKDIYERQLPELDAEFAKGFGANSAEDLRDKIRKSLEERKAEEAARKFEMEMFDKIVDTSKFGDIPELLINHEVESMLHELEHSIESQGGRFDDYLSSLKKTRDQLTLDLLPDALKRVKVSLVIREISILEKINSDEKEIDHHIEHMKKHYHADKEILERLDSADYRIYSRNIITNRKVVERLKEWNFAKDMAGKHEASK